MLTWLARGLTIAVALASSLAGGASAQTLPISESEATVPGSLAQIAATARAAAIVVRATDTELEQAMPDVLALFGVRRPQELGAGVVVDPRGYALTSARLVLLGDELDVLTADGTAVKAAVVGLDRRTDVALLKLAPGPKPFPYLPLGDSQGLRAGDWVIAVGVPHGLATTVAAGIVTATPSPAGTVPLGRFLQTDAVSGLTAGAPLVNTRGEVVGLGTGHGGDAVAYALPSSTVRKIYLELLETGRVSRPWLGVTTQTLTADLARLLGAPDTAGVLVTDALPDGPSASVLRSGDIVLEVGGSPVTSRLQLDQAVEASRPGRSVTVAFRREGRRMSGSIALGEEPDTSQVSAPLVHADRLLGIEVSPITPSMGAVAAEVDNSGPAAAAGIEPGDVIREVDRRPIRSILDFEAAVRDLTPGAPVLLLVQRGDIAVYVAVTARAAESPPAPTRAPPPRPGDVDDVGSR